LQTAYDIDSKDPRLTERDFAFSLEDVFHSAILSIEEEEENSTGELKKAAMMKNLGNSLMKSNQFTEAIRYYTAAIELDDRNAIYYGNRAAAYSKLNDFKNAVKDCEKAIEIDPKYAKAYGRMGLAYTSLEQNDQAIEAFKKAVELDPGNESYQSNLKLALEKKEKPTPTPPAGLAGLNIDWANLFSNPAFRNMASSLMQDQTIINALSAGMNSSLNPGAPGPSTSGESSASGNSPVGGNNRNFDMLLEAGQYLAAQMHAANPDLVEQFRQNTSRSSNPPNSDNRDPQ